ncbi:hypothetical protein HFU84_12100 [Acidithiobacillus sp. CV18-2]|nr:hypothetical protein [Acidithiobacillus sp. CV18-3]MBU2758346.1 hypothetical protein [Acidithiobacillus sp. BN09-2]MBU2778229.1 hypothetical protein [Acidithiobacillus sp. CV18-2]MBU2799102.1 hypothetical protein [Acidithiobacillus sp. VAN18-4]
MERIMFVSHGDKGGCGKSYVSTIVVEHLLNAGNQVALVEADPTQPDVGKRYLDDADVEIGTLSLNRAGDAENALSEFGAWLETADRDFVVVNLPAGAGETLDNQGDLMRDLADSLGYRMIVSYALEKNRIAAQAMLRSLKSGLLSHIEPENRVVCIPEFKGEPYAFEWMDMPERKNADIREVVIPALKNRQALQRLEASRGRIAALIDKDHRPDGWMILDQSSVWRWYQLAMTAAAKIIGEV